MVQLYPFFHLKGFLEKYVACKQAPREDGKMQLERLGFTFTANGKRQTQVENFSE